MFSAWFLRPAVFQEWYCFFDSCNWRTLTVEVQKVSCWQYPCLFFCCLLVNQWFKIFFLSMQSFLFRVFPSLFLLIDYFLQVSSEKSDVVKQSYDVVMPCCIFCSCGKLLSSLLAYGIFSWLLCLLHYRHLKLFVFDALVLLLLIKGLTEFLSPIFKKVLGEIHSWCFCFLFQWMFNIQM